MTSIPNGPVNISKSNYASDVNNSTIEREIEELTQMLSSDEISPLSATESRVAMILGPQLLGPSCSARTLSQSLNPLAQLSSILYQRFTQGEARYLDLAIQCQVHLVSLTPEEDVNLSRRLSMLGSFYLARFEYHEKLADIRQAVKHAEKGVMLSRPTESYLSDQLTTLGIAYIQQYQHFGSLGDIDKAVDALGKAVLLTPYDDPAMYERLMHLGISRQNRFRHQHEADDINAAIEHQVQALSLVSQQHDGFITCLINLGASYLCRFRHGKDNEDAELAVKSHSRALSIISRSHSMFPDTLYALGTSYAARAEKTRNCNDINKAIEFQEEALTLVQTRGATPSTLSTYLEGLGTSYSIRFEHLEEMTDIDKAIQSYSRSVSHTHNECPELARRLNDLGKAYLARFERLHEVFDIEKAVEHCLKSVATTPQTYAEKPGRLGNLGNAYIARFKWFGEKDDLDNAIGSNTQALALLPKEGAESAYHLSSLGNSYTHSFEQSGSLEDINQAIMFQTQALEVIPANHPDTPTMQLNMSNALAYRYIHLGRLEDIDNAIGRQMRSLSSISQDHPAFVTLLHNLGSCHEHRFDRLGQLYDLSLAIELKEKALRLLSDSNVKKPAWLSSLGKSYRRRFVENVKLDDLDAAIEYQTTAVLNAPNGHPHTAEWLTALGGTYVLQFEHLSRSEDIEEALKYLSQAISQIPEGHTNFPGCLNNLAQAHAIRHKYNGDSEDIETAIQHQTRAALLIPHGHKNRGNYFYNLARMYLDKFELFGTESLLASALKYFETSAKIFPGDPSLRIRAAYMQAFHTPPARINERLEAFQIAMDLIPELVWIGTTIHQRYDGIKKLKDVVLEAATTAIEAKDYVLALQWLEEGRSVVWNQILQLRTPLDTLADAHPDLARQMRHAADEIHSSSLTPTPILSLESHHLATADGVAQKHRRSAERYKNLLDQVRLIPGFESFLKPVKGSELMAVAQRGPLAIINIHESRCDTLILTPGSSEITHVPLVSLSVSKLAQLRIEMGHLIGRGRKQRDNSRRPLFEPEEEISFRDILSSLWLNIAKPIVDVLGLKPLSSVDELPHLTWCVTGALSLLPLHAAGLYNQKGSKLSDYLISSYTPTLGFLLHGDRPSSLPTSSILTVGQESTPGLGDLPETVLELAKIRQYLPLHTYTELTRLDATKNTVLDMMQTHDWVHFACHAHQDINDPTESGFFLSDGTLSIASITERSLKNKGLAFLSACQTATGDKTLTDESVHLASAMLAAGYWGVVATMWSIQDSDGPMVAGKFYEKVIKDGRMDHTEAAKALHVAVGNLRAEVGETQFERWVPFVHFGA
ncbi:CHAT domain protein [Rhizoctonia solani]|uniref:CHAT domain protein n=1 Tax=Rhizoctonia solani TaxID=456999 RepID=A0A8H8P524_9AGAM|nr:CHAT domain protein [Rhizoctonia solani]QRW25669.1 CHAT domain protein [Rhizoctonia solani]